MKKLKLFLFASLFCVLFTQVVFADEPPNLGQLKLDLIAYYETGDYRKDQTRVALDAQKYIKKRIDQNNNADPKKKLAIVMDIDETALSNFKDYRHLNFGGSSEDLSNMVEQGDKSSIPPVLNLYRYAKSRGVAIFFVTGRFENLREMTIENLKSAGYYHWNGLFMKPINYKNRSVVPYKSMARKKITDMGYDIIANIGDQESDLLGGYADKSFKLPNPFYLIQ